MLNSGRDYCPTPAVETVPQKRHNDMQLLPTKLKPISSNGTSTKPTTFLLSGLATIETEIGRYSTHAMPAALRMGKTSSAEYSTACGSQGLPPQLCRAIAESVKAHVATFVDTDTHDLVFEAVDDWVRDIHTSANTAAMMGANRAGNGM